MATFIVTCCMAALWADDVVAADEAWVKPVTRSAPATPETAAVRKKICVGFVMWYLSF
jgi:hypothetical protein